MGDEIISGDQVIPDAYLELDQVHLPKAPHSGLLDTGTISEREEELTTSQAQNLQNVLNTYYQGGESLSDFRENLVQLGYGNDRVDEIATAAHVEFTYRSGHSGNPSGLTTNQEIYLNNTLTNEEIAGLVLNFNDQGQAISYRSNIRTADDTRIFMPIPAPIPFEVLTRAQRESINNQLEIANILESHLQADPTINDRYFGTPHDLRDDEIRQISDYSTQYLNNQITIQDLANQITSIYGIVNVNDVHLVLSEYLIDIQADKDYRDNNQGRPQELSQEQYDFMLQNELRGAAYNNQAIFIVPNTDTKYFYDERGYRIPVPNVNPDGTLAENQDVLVDDVRRDTANILTIFNQPDGLTGRDTEDGIRPNRAVSLSVAQRNEINTRTQLVINGDISLNDYLSSLERYNLNNAQESDLISYISAQRDFGPNSQAIANQYLDTPLFPYTFNGETILVSQRNFEAFRQASGIPQAQIEQEINGIRIEFDRSHEARVGALFQDNPPSATITPTITPVVTQHQTLQQLRNQNAPGGQPRPVITPSAVGLGEAHDRRNQNLPPIDTTRHTFTIEEELAEQLPRPERIPSNIPVVPGGTQPIDPASGQEFEVGFTEEAIRRYNDYYNSNQYLYSNFRIEYAYLLRSSIGLLGAGIGYQMSIIFRNKFFLYSQLREQRQNLYTSLVNRLQRREQQLDSKILLQDAEELEEAVEIAIEREELQQTLTQRISEFRRDARSFVRENFPSFNQRKNELAAELRNLDSRGVLPSDDSYRRIEEQLFDIRQRLGVEEIRFLEQNVPDFRDIEEQRDMVRISKNNLIAKLRNSLNERKQERLKIKSLDKIDQSLYNSKIANLMADTYETLTDINNNFEGIMSGLVIGDVLGASLAGFIFPTYQDEDFQEIYERNVVPVDDVNLNVDNAKFNEILKNEEKLKAFDNVDKVPILAGSRNPFNNKPIYKDASFVPVKANQGTGRLPTYKEIQDLKSTLNKDELKKLQNKRLIFDDNNNIVPKNNDKCANVVKQNQINMISIR